MKNKLNSDAKQKLEIKLNTYINKKLNTDIETAISQFQIPKKSEFFRNAIEFYLQFLRYFSNTHRLETTKPYNFEQLETYFQTIIEKYEPNRNFVQELKEHISPLKTSILMLKEGNIDPTTLPQLISATEKGFEQLETFMLSLNDMNDSSFNQRIDLLYIEDNDLDRDTITLFFSNQGINIHSVSSVQEAKAFLKATIPKVILMDINLKTSPFGGDRFCKLLKSNQEYSFIPIFLISAFYQDQNEEIIKMRTGCDGIITKPLDSLDDLKEILEYI